MERHTYAHLRINHYYTKSWEEFQAKLNRASTSTHAFPLPDVPFDIPAEPDLVVARWVPRTKAVISEMRQLSPRPYRYGSRLRMARFPISDKFSVEANSVVANEAAGLERPHIKPASKSLPLPGIRGALVRVDDRSYALAPGRLLASVHARQEIDWLGAEVSWRSDDGVSSLEAEAGVAERSDGTWRVRFRDPGGSIVIPTGGPPLRCHALLFALGVPARARATIETREATSGWEPSAAFDIPDEGGYLGLIALEKRPRTLDAVRLRLSGADRLEVYDLALLSFG
jgi:hypothetical protein